MTPPCLTQAWAQAHQQELEIRQKEMEMELRAKEHKMEMRARDQEMELKQVGARGMLRACVLARG